MRNSIHKRFLKIMAICLFFEVSCLNSVQALQEPICKFVEGRRVETFEDIINKSKSIAVYVLTIAQESIKTINEGHKAFEYTLDLARVIKGNPVYQFTALGYPPREKIPAYYFDLYHLHKEIVETRNFKIGHSAVAYIDSERKCRMVPFGVIGYYVLIIEGINSGISFAPLTSPRYDPLVQKLASFTEQGRAWGNFR